MTGFVTELKVEPPFQIYDAFLFTVYTSKLEQLNVTQGVRTKK